MLIKSFSVLGVFQSTPPRGRRHIIGKPFEHPFIVSIHASTREATHGPGWSVALAGVSIHASTREATC